VLQGSPCCPSQARLHITSLTKGDRRFQHMTRSSQSRAGTSKWVISPFCSCPAKAHPCRHLLTAERAAAEPTLPRAQLRLDRLRAILIQALHPV